MYTMYTLDIACNLTSAGSYVNVHMCIHNYTHCDGDDDDDEDYDYDNE